MMRKNLRPGGVRLRIAAAAARIMAEDGVDSFALAKRKAARQLGVDDERSLPANEEIEAELNVYRSIYQAAEHPERILELRRIALDAMLLLRRFKPYLAGSVLKGIAGRYAEIELQLFPESAKEVEIFLLDRGIAYSSVEVRRYSGGRARAVARLSIDWQETPLKLTVFDPRDERLSLKATPAGKIMERADIAEVSALVAPLASADMSGARRRAG